MNLLVQCNNPECSGKLHCDASFTLSKSLRCGMDTEGKVNELFEQEALSFLTVPLKWSA